MMTFHQKRPTPTTYSNIYGKHPCSLAPSSSVFGRFANFQLVFIKRFRVSAQSPPFFPQRAPGLARGGEQGLRGNSLKASKALLPCNHWRGLYGGGRRERTSGRIVIRGEGGGGEERERVACLPRIHFQDSSSYRPPSLLRRLLFA